MIPERQDVTLVLCVEVVNMCVNEMQVCAISTVQVYGVWWCNQFGEVHDGTCSES